MAKESNLIFPQEIVLWYVLPTIRKEFALEMIKQGLSQKEVSSMLKISTATVSHYKKNQRANEIDLGKEIKEEIKNSVQRIVNNKSTLFNEIIKIESLIRSSGTFCQIHKSKCKIDQEGCKECKKTYLGIK
jgi:predicted transcriptional regulator